MTRQLPESGPENAAWRVIGGGNMAWAIVSGALASGIFPPDRFAVAEPDASKHARLIAVRVRAVPTAREVLDGLGPRDHVLLAVKPQILPEIAPVLRNVFDQQPHRTRVVSILAGTPTAKLESLLGANAGVIRVMPNTPAQIRRSTTAIALGASARDGEEKEAIDLFSALGSVFPMREDLFDAFTALAGSGPAYLFYLAESLEKAGLAHGFAPDQIDQIVRCVLAGSAALLDTQRGHSPADLRAAVTSKGGTTAAAIRVLEQAGVPEAIVRAVAAGAARSLEISQG
jgi:pyrroline-5-carboxylate reductase